MPHKLLLADDSVTIQRVIELTFADEDVQVLAVGDGKQAIARVQADHPDIVLADVGMPERDGYEVAQFIKSTPEFAHIPVLLLTGAFEPVDEARAQAVGCDGVLVKPFEPQMVINRVKDLLAGRRPQGSWSGSPAPQAPLKRPVAAAAARTDLDLQAAPPAQPAALGGSLEDYFDRLDAAFASLDGGSSSSAVAAAPGPAVPPPSAPSPVAPPPATFAPPAPVAPPSQLSPIDDLAGWDPDLTGDPARTVEAAPAAPEPPRTIAPPPAYAPPAPAVAAPAPTHAPPAPAACSPPAPVPAASAPAAPPSAAAPVAQQPLAPPPSLAEAFAALLSAEQGQPITPAKLRPEMVSDEVIDEVVRRVSERLQVRDTVLDVAERLVREEIAKIRGA